MKALRKLLSNSDEFGFHQEWRDLMRAIAGGMIFGAPLLYTMEMWFEGQIFSPTILATILLSVLLLNILFSYFAGLREKHLRHRVSFAFIDGVSSIGLGVFLSAGVLYLLKRIDLSDNIKASVGKVLLEACVVSIGMTFTNLKFKGKMISAGTRSVIQSSFAVSAPKRQFKKDLNDMVAAMVGAFVFSFNVAPTEEIVLIASELDSFDLLILLIFEMSICYVILYSSGLKHHRVYSGSFFQGAFNELLVTTSISLIVSFLLLVSLGYNGLNTSGASLVPALIVLGLPAVIGGAAGRLVV